MAEKYLSAEEHHAMRSQRHPGQSKYLRSVLMIVGVAIIAGLSFYGGVKYQTNHQKTAAVSGGGSTTGPVGSSGFGGGRRSGGQRPTFGQVTAVSSSSITVQNQSGTDSTLAIVSSTTISDNGQAVTADDIKVGDTVAVIASSSDSTQATRILVNPSFGGGAAPSAGQSQTN